MDGNRSDADALPLSSTDVAFLVSTSFSESTLPGSLGQEAYSYRFVARAFQPLLERIGSTREVSPAESRLEFGVREEARAGRSPIHLSFLPLHRVYLRPGIPTVAYPFWEFPDLPSENLEHNARNDWRRIAAKVDLLLTASSFLKATFERAGVTTPIRVVPVPTDDAYFQLPPWQAGQARTLSVPNYALPEDGQPPVETNCWQQTRKTHASLRARAAGLYKDYVKPRLPEHWQLAMKHVKRAWLTGLRLGPEERSVALPLQPSLRLGGVVYTSFINPFDPRKNWHDLLTAFLLSLGDRPDATLAIKVVASEKQTSLAVNTLLTFYRQLGLRHRCKIAILPGYLSDRQMLELTEASAYYVSASRAEGACLPLQAFLAAGRPGISAVHTALTDYFDDRVGFVVDSAVEPTSWPHDPEHGCRTTWHRLNWQSLCDAFRESHALAVRQPAGLGRLSQSGRERMRGLVGADEVWPRLVGALDVLRGAGLASHRPTQLPCMV